MAQHVLHVLGTDVAGLHHLVDRARRDARAEQFDEQHEPDGLATDGAGARGQELEVLPAGVAEGSERGGQRTGGGARLVLEQLELVGWMLDVFADAPGAGMHGDLLVFEEDPHGVVVGAHEHLLRHEPPGDRVRIAVERDAEHLRDAGALDVIGVERGGRQWTELALLLVGEDESGDLARHFVNATVGEVVTPRGGLHVEVEQVAESTAGPEAGADESDRTLDPPLLISPANVAGADPEAAGASVLEEPRVEPRRGGRVREHHRLHVVEDVDGGRPAEECQAVLHASEERAHALAHRELDVEQAGVAEHGDERAHSSRDAGQREAEVGPVDLHGFAWGELQGEERLG